MKVQYHFNSFDKKRMNVAIGNLMGNYYNEVSLKLNDALESLKKESRIRDWVVQRLRESKGTIGTTVDTSFSSLEAVLSQGDMFWFEVDGLNPCAMTKGKKELDMVVSINDYYLLTQLSMRNFYGKFSLSKHPKTLDGEKQRWMDWFEHHLKNDKDVRNHDFVRKVIE